MATQRTRRARPIKSVPPKQASPTSDPEPVQRQDVRSIRPDSVINALQASLNEKAEQIRVLEDRIVMINAVIAEQDQEIAALRQPRAVRRSKTTPAS